MAYAIPVAPWTQQIELRWQPDLHFYERRTEILRSLEAEGLLTGFQWQDKRIGARLGQFEVVYVTDSALSASINGPRTSSQGVRAAISMALDALEPINVTLHGMTFQYLLPISGDGTLAQEQTARRLAPEILPEATPRDWAILLDGRSTRLQSDFQVEFGVLRAEEMAGRLHGRLASFMPELQEPSPVDLSDLPDGGMYYRWEWQMASLLDEDRRMEELIELWVAAAEQSEQHSEALQRGRGLADIGKQETNESR